MRRINGLFRAFLLICCLSRTVGAQSLTPAMRTVDVAGGGTNILTMGMEKRTPGDPLVVFQSGLGSELETWMPVIQHLSGEFALLAYDRPGIGGSAASPFAPTMASVSGHLHELLAELRAPPPYILVGHSWGGPLIQYYAGEYAEDIDGLVFVDPTDWTQDGLVYVDRVSLMDQGFDGMQVDSLVALNDSLALELQSQTDENVAALPGIAAEWQIVKAVMSTPADERGFPESLRVPTAILVSGQVQAEPPFSASLVRAHRSARLKSFTDVVRDLPRATLVFATHTGHFIQQEDPVLVSEAIRRVALAR